MPYYLVGEEGPELVDLPPGTRIIRPDDSPPQPPPA